MKKYFVIVFSLLLCVSSFAQSITDFYDECIEPEIDGISLRALVNSEDGYWFPTKGTYRMLVIFVNIIYDVTPDSVAPHVVNPYWQVTNQEGVNVFPMKNYFDSVFDVNNTLPRQGFFTRFMSECSIDNFVMLGDFTTVEIKESRIRNNSASGNESKFRNEVINYINNYTYPNTGTSLGLQAYYGHNAIANYDNATCKYTNNGTTYPPSPVSNNKIDYVAFLVLNPNKDLVGTTGGSGFTSNGGIATNLKLSNGLFPIECWTVSGASNGHLKNGAPVLVHEFAHCLLGGNEFHTSGGNHLSTNNVATFLFSQQGYGLFQADNAFRSCNAYERWRLGWHHSSNATYKISANGINSDIQSQFTGTQTYYIRDFVKYGDAIRIKLPYKDSGEASNQYIWLENHQLGRNGKLDGFNYHFPPPGCIPLGTPGIYSFIQVGRDVLEGESGTVYFANEKDNLRMISAEGNLNMLYTGKDNDCKGWGNRPTFEHIDANPLSGANGKTEAIITTNHNLPNLQPFSDFTYVGNKIKNGILYNQILWCGDVSDAFVAGSIMDISSNPPPINAYTHYARYYKLCETCTPTYTKVENHRDTRNKYLTGLSIKMNYAYTLADGTEVFKVDIGWDDYDVKEDVNWAGDIVLKEKLNLLSGKNISFVQNRTPSQINRDPISGVFAPPTLFTCEENSEFIQHPNSQVTVKEKSKMILKNGSSYVISNNAQLIVENGSLIIEEGANFLINGTGKLIINNNGMVTISNITQLDMNAEITIHPGGKLILDGGTLTSACPNQMWQGIRVAGNENMPQTPQNQGVLELKNGAVIENAITAIATYEPKPDGSVKPYTNGGIIQAENTTFRNNGRSVEFLIYSGGGTNPIPQNVSYFKNCTFIVDDNNLFQNGPLPQITMWAVTGVKIQGCEFINNMSTMFDERKAIYTIDAGYFVDEFCTSFNKRLCQCNVSSTPSVFHGFNTAIESTNSTNQYAIKIDRSEFYNNTTGIFLKGKNSFRISELDMSQNINNSSVARGIRLNNCTGYKIEGNTINHLPTGILVANPGIYENKIYRNDISNALYGIKVGARCTEAPILRGFPATGLQFICHNFSNNIYDIYICSDGMIRESQGVVSNGADNKFSSNATYNFYCENLNSPVFYHYDYSVPEKEPVSKTNNISIHNATANSCVNTSCAEETIKRTTDDEPLRDLASTSSLETYRELNQHFAEMMRVFYEKGYDEMLTNYYNGIIENEYLLNEAIAYHEEILEVTDYMAEISRSELFKLKTDSLIDLIQIRDWYDEIYTLNAKYSLAETYYQLREFEAGFNTLALIPEMYNLTEDELIEHNNYVALFTLKNNIRLSGRTIAQLNEVEINQMIIFAAASRGLSSVMAQGILCFFYNICLEEDTDEGEGRKQKAENDDDEINLRKSVSSVSSVCQKTLENITVMPNPTTGELRIENGEWRIMEVEVFDVYGRNCNVSRVTCHENKINISHLQAGIYFVKIQTEIGEITKKIIKQ